ncbi:MAG: NHL repeat-containing protein, partial [bacterium]
DWTSRPLADFLIVASPTALAAGQGTQVTVTALNSLGGVKTDYNSNVRLTALNGTLASLTWSGTGVTPGGPGIATLSGTQFISGIALATLTDTKPEGPIILRVDNLGAIASQSAVINSPTWTFGPLATLIIRDAANGAGSVVGARSMAVGDILNVWAAGYDAYNNFRQDEAASWSTIPTLDPIGIAGPAATSFFQPSTEFTNGLIHAAVGAISDDTGAISVLSAKPKAPVLTAVGEPNQIRLTWPAITTYEDGRPLDPMALKYEIWRSTTPGVYAGPPDFITTNFGETFYVDNAVTEWVTYYYKIKALKVAGGVESNFSNEAHAASSKTPLSAGKVCAAQGAVYHPPNELGYVNRPGDLALGGSAPGGVNYIYVADTDNSRISVFDENCVFYSIWGEFGFLLGQYRTPTGVLYKNGADRLYVVDYADRIQEVDTTTGNALRPMPVPQPWKMEWGAGGNILVASLNKKIYNVDPASGNVINSFPTPGAHGVVYNPSNSLIYVSDDIGNVVRAYDSGGNEVASAKIGHGAGSAYGYFNNPTDLTVDAAGNIYVADAGNNRIQIFNTSGDILNVITNGGPAVGDIRGSKGIGLSPRTGNLWVADFYGQRLVEFVIPPGGP